MRLKEEANLLFSLRSSLSVVYVLGGLYVELYTLHIFSFAGDKRPNGSSECRIEFDANEKTSGNKNFPKVILRCNCELCFCHLVSKK